MVIRVFMMLRSIGVEIPVFFSDSCSSSSFTLSQSMSGRVVVEIVVVITSVISIKLVVTPWSFKVGEVACSFVCVVSTAEVVLVVVSANVLEGLVVDNASVVVVGSTIRYLGKLMIFPLRN